MALYLNGAHKVIPYSVVSTSTATSAPVHPREVYQPAILVGATAVSFLKPGTLDRSPSIVFLCRGATLQRSGYHPAKLPLKFVIKVWRFRDAILKGVGKVAPLQRKKLRLSNLLSSNPALVTQRFRNLFSGPWLIKLRLSKSEYRSESNRFLLVLRIV